MTVYLIAKLKVKAGGLQRFGEIMAEVVPATEDFGWSLVGAYRTVIGDVNEVMHIWQVDDANAVGGVMDAIRANPPGALIAHGAELMGLIEEDVLTVQVKAPYSP